MIFHSRYIVRKLVQTCIQNTSSQYKPKALQSLKPFLLQRNHSSTTNIRQEQEQTKERAGINFNEIFRGQLAIDIQEYSTRNLIVNKTDITENDWAEMFNELKNIKFHHSIEGSWDSRNLEMCYSMKKLNAGRTYLNYMKTVGKKYDPAVVSIFIKLCYACREECTKEDLLRVTKFTNYLLSKYSIVMDNVIAESVIKGLCLLDDWERCRNIVEKSSVCDTSAIRSAYIMCLLNCNQFDLVWKSLEEWRINLNLQSNVYIELLDVFGDRPEKTVEILKLFRDSDIMLNQTVCDHLMLIFSNLPEPYRLKGTYVNIRNNGECSNCNETLTEIDISEDQFETLREAFLNQVLINTDALRNTSSEELQNFYKCVEENAPFDVVIDGSSVMYMNGTKSYITYTRLLTDTVRHFVERDQKVFIVGKKHMNEFPADSMKYIEENATLFLRDDVTKDDELFIIYAALYSGPDCFFVSKDNAKSETLRLTDFELLNLFKRWKQSRQSRITFISSSGRLYFRNSCLFQMNVQQSKKGWHIPYVTDSYSPIMEYGVHEQWLCLNK